MNTLLKGAIAGVAGIALLLGGAGTFALWNSSATVAGGTIVAGQLKVANNPAAGVWTVNNTVTSLASYRAVPGDVMVFTKTMDITATGDNLVADLGLAEAAISPTVSSTPADIALADYLIEGAVLTATGSGINTVAGVTTITAGTAGINAQPVTVTATITFPKSTTAGFENDTMLGSVSLAGMALTLTQK
ncbi:alternate-type signal peptide domain-containing protein [Cryobacterium frigoriphilum]|uniref:Alternate-type signal peptide domain-containing protein n=1 Tax=Cryobacterium frigoriphilum TaxID=1259150 RepID=A0A4R9A9V3_9MICO|nr:alternate-type signal peptide domain-containing protein [Cryobacterium frigoriphilum]TFD54522.1 alternate-type signal peptide domain-containing protein [Cryobacterium frigoriphilum]